MVQDLKQGEVFCRRHPFCRETVSPKLSKGTFGNPFHILKFGHHVGVLPVGLGPHEAQYGKHKSVCLKVWIHIRTDHAGPGLFKSVFVIFVTDVSTSYTSSPRVTYL